MRKRKQRLLSVILTLGLLVGLLPIQVLAVDTGSFDATGGTVTYEIRDGSAVITGCEDTVTANRWPPSGRPRRRACR